MKKLAAMILLMTSACGVDGSEFQSYDTQLEACMWQAEAKAEKMWTDCKAEGINNAKCDLHAQYVGWYEISACEEDPYAECMAECYIAEFGFRSFNATECFEGCKSMN